MPVAVKKELNNGEITSSIGLSEELIRILVSSSKDHYLMVIPACTDNLIPPHDTITSRFVGKIALETLAQSLSSLDDGLDQLIVDKQFDPIRSHVRRCSPRA